MQTLPTRQTSRATQTTEQTTREIIHLCHAGLDARTLRVETLRLCGRVIPTAAACCVTTDPATLLLTGGNVHSFEPQATAGFVHNEYLQDDFNKFRDLAKLRQPISTLHIATRGNPRRSRRFREMLEPQSLGNELRAVFRSGGATWGAICLHREARNQDFTDADIAFITAIAPHIATGLRQATLLAACNESAANAPGLLLLADDLTVLSATPAAELLLAEVADKGYWPQGNVLPLPVCTAVAKLQALSHETQPTQTIQPGARENPCVRLRTRAGRWLTLHASRTIQAADQIAIIIEQATPNDIAPYVLRAYALTTREQEVAALVLKGLSTDDISTRLCISTLTVQQHLKAIFDKVGVRSRRELVAQIFAQSYWPAMASDHGLSPASWSPA